MASIKVAVRVRPLNQREKDMKAELIIRMNGKRTSIINPKATNEDEIGGGESRRRGSHHQRTVKEFTFDHSYWSLDDYPPLPSSPSSPKKQEYASQERLYADLGTDVVDCAFEGYNACVLAYGQTGSGKTFTMTGTKDNQGLIPRICKSLFERMSAARDESGKSQHHRVHVSYLEIYQERVADLLRKGGATSTTATSPPSLGSCTNLRVREHPKKGPYVEGLSTRLVTNYEEIEECMNRGNAQRRTAATHMNDSSSRSHAIFTITFVQAALCDGVPNETVSKIHLVDLAGSERAQATQSSGERLKEGAHINKSLVTLGSCISALSEACLEMMASTIAPEAATTTTPPSGGHVGEQQRRSSSANHQQIVFVPYRDSVLTWLLRDSLGGNAKTIVIATISPAACNYGETLSTLRYANRAKRIVNRPRVNEDAHVKLIRELRHEIAQLRALMMAAPLPAAASHLGTKNNGDGDHEDDGGKATEKDRVVAAQQTEEAVGAEMIARLQRKEAREKLLTEEWTGKWREARAILCEQRALGLRKKPSGPGVVLDSDRPHLVAIDDDPLTTGVTLYHLKEGVTTIGTDDAEDIALRGCLGAEETERQHCTITLTDGVATLEATDGAHVSINNVPLDGGTTARLSQGSIIFFGRVPHVFRFNDPAEAAQLRKNGGEEYLVRRRRGSDDGGGNLRRAGACLSWSTPDLKDNDVDSAVAPRRCPNNTAARPLSLQRCSSTTSSIFYYTPPPPTTTTPSIEQDRESIAASISSSHLIDIDICDFHLRGSGTRTHYVYEIRIRTVDDRWAILRRYSRFRDLHLTMKSRYGARVARIPFPSRRLLPSFLHTTSGDESLARARQRDLQTYLVRLIDCCWGRCQGEPAMMISRAALTEFSPFFRRGSFENGKHGTS